MKKVAQFLIIADETTSIKVKNPGILEVPKDKGFGDLPLSHYTALEEKKGRGAVMRALLNLERWNSNNHPSTSAKARAIINALKKKHKK
jgi:hypothetical protein